MAASLADRLMSKIEISNSGCWEWTASLRKGYGQIRGPRDSTGRYPTLAAHRVSYELARGPIPDGLEPDHLCGNTKCVNPDHLEVVTRRTNVLRSEGTAALNARKTHCPRNHPLPGKSNRSDGRRRCNECRRAA